MQKNGFDCMVAAPSLIPKDNKKVKNDRLDAIKLAVYLRAGILTPIAVPGEEKERDRDLVRFRVFQVNELVRIKQSICAFLLRKGLDYSEYSPFSVKFIDFISTLELHVEDRKMLNKLINHYNYESRLVDELANDIAEMSKTERYKDMCSYLRAFRGIDTTTAMIILTHIPDFRTFPHPGNLMSYIGLTSGESASAERVQHYGITKKGNGILRKAIILAAQQYSRANKVGYHLRLKRKGMPSPILAIADRADRRCFKKYYRMLARNKKPNVAKTAVARELVGFIWEAMMYHYQGELKEVS